jgi:Fur family ferric uptake transcriptional regulator
MTKKRQQLLKLLQQGSQPMNAAQLHKELQSSQDLTTIYRGLQYLEQQDLADSFVYECEDRGIERYYIAKNSDHRHYMHCEHCHRFIAFSGCPLEGAVEKLEAEYGFKISEHFITLKGVCSDCT